MAYRILFCLLLLSHFANAQDKFNLILLSHWNDTNLAKVDGDQIWNDVSGWNDTLKNKEYLIAGSTDSIYFFDITNPTTMIKCDVEEGHSRNAINRDYEVYDHYLYCVSDRTSPLGSLQIFDLQYLPDSVHKVYDKDTFSINTHTLFIEASRKRLYLCASNYKPAGFRSMSVFDLSNPEDPKFLGELDKTLGCTYTHEVFVKNDTAFCSCGNNGLYIFDLRDMNNQKVLGSITPPYVQSGFNHSSWMDSTGKYLMFTDENQGLGIKIYNIEQLSDPQYVTVFNSHPGALPHNAYWKGGFAYVSSYEDGVYVYDLRNVASFVQHQIPPTAGWYDTYPRNASGVYNGFHGCWGVWPYLQSGNIVASDISEGLFVFKPSPTLGISTESQTLSRLQVFPNPAASNALVSIQSLVPQQAHMRIHTITGKLMSESAVSLKPGENEINLNNLEGLTTGLYLVTIQSGSGFAAVKLIKD